MKSILIVEGEKPVRSVLTFTLNRAGFEIGEARSCLEAREHMATRRPDLILLDWTLPGSSSGCGGTAQSSRNARWTYTSGACARCWSLPATTASFRSYGALVTGSPHRASELTRRHVCRLPCSCGSACGFGIPGSLRAAPASPAAGEEVLAALACAVGGSGGLALLGHVHEDLL